MQEEHPVATAPAGADGGLQLLSSLGVIDIAYQSTNFLRAITGTLMGTGLGFLMFPMLLEAEEDLQ